MEYRLEKISIKSGHFSSIFQGQSTTSRNCFYAEFNVDGEKVVDIDSPTISDIKVGGYLLVVYNKYDLIKTSEIEDILDMSEKSITFGTTTSVYKLEIENEE